MAMDLSENRVIDESVNSVDSVQWSNSDVPSDSINQGVAETVILLKSDKGQAPNGENGSNSTRSEVMMNRDEYSCDELIINQAVNSVYRSCSENASDFIDPGVLETVIEINPDMGNGAGVIGENEHLVHSKAKVNMDEGLSARQRIGGPVASIHSVMSHSSSSMHFSKSIEQGVGESAIVIRSNKGNAACVSAENRDIIPSNIKENETGLRKVSVDESRVKDEKHLCVIDIKSGGAGGKFGENLDCERVCRICHLGSDQRVENSIPNTTATDDVMDVIHLGCGCKDELGMAHSHCAEAWFKLKGNRLCEICGVPATNVISVGDNRFTEEWNDRRSSVSGTNLSERSGGCCWRQPFCNFLMACLVIAFVLPWFFRVNMF